VRRARVDEDHHLPGPRADIDGPRGRGIEPQALAIDAGGEPGRLAERLQPRPVPQVPGRAGEDVAPIGRDEELPTPLADRLMLSPQ
jgi:hypothetical protein